MKAVKVEDPIARRPVQDFQTRLQELKKSTQDKKGMSPEDQKMLEEAIKYSKEVKQIHSEFTSLTETQRTFFQALSE